MAQSTPELTQLLAQQAKLIEVLAERLSISSLAPSSTADGKQSIDAITNSISEFCYEPESKVTFDSWFKRFEDLFTYDLASQEDQWKVRLLLRKLGTIEHEKYLHLILPKLPKDMSFSQTVDKLRSIFGEQSTIFNIRYNCLKLTKNDTDDIVTYAATINRESERFKLNALSEDQFKCLLFISGLHSAKDADTRTRLLNKMDQDPATTLDALLAECKRLQSIKQDSSMIQNVGSSIHAVRSRPRTVYSREDSRSTELGTRGQPGARTAGLGTVNGRSGSRPAGLGPRGHPGSRSAGFGPRRHLGSRSAGLGSLNADSRNFPPSRCWLCGAWHYVRLCPFKQHRCRECNRSGHKEGFCHSANKPYNKSKPQLLSLISSVNTGAEVRRKFVTVHINGHECNLQLDTASDISILSRSMWENIGAPVLEHTNHTATSACGGLLKLHGRLNCCITFQGKSFTGSCYVTDSDLNLLGLDWIELLQIADFPLSSICNKVCPVTSTKFHSDAVLQRFSQLFEKGLGCFTPSQAELRLVSGSSPVFRPKRPVPYAALPLVDAELTRLVDNGVIVPVSYSKWAAPIVVVKKANGSIRLCADFSTGLNAVLETHCYPLPMPEDLFTVLNGGRFFAKLDLADAYLQIEVEPRSRELLTINTHRGLFQYTRLPFGIKTAPAIFQQMMDSLLSGLPGVGVYLDDIIIVGESESILHERIIQVLSRIQHSGFRLRPEKCQLFLKSIKFLGFVFDAAGRHPDPENIRAIQKMPAPQDLPGLRSFLGLISYYSAFLPSLHNVRAPLNRLLQKDVGWNWSPDCEQAFAHLKAMLSSKMLLTHFDPTLPITVAADASNYGVGAVLLHTFADGSQKAVVHVSRTLTDAERNYGQIEKEALALVFAVKKFHKFIYGRRFSLITDHKPLISVFGTKKGIPAHSANRLQRWATILLGYDFDISHSRTEDFGQADALSRLIARNDTVPEDTVVAALCVEEDVKRSLTDAVRGLPVTATHIRLASIQDPLIQKVKHYVHTAWPRQSFSGELQQLFQRRESLSIVNDCLMSSNRVVVPEKLRPTVLRQFHTSHPGTGRTKMIARSYAYWPGMDQQIEEMVKRCSKCQQAAKNPPRQPPTPWQEPTGPWQRLHLDFAGPINGISYLVIVDAYSKWPEIFPMQSTTAFSTIRVLRQLFSQHGLPETLVSDNGTQFTSDNFSEFCRRNCIDHKRAPPYHPQSNGQAERFVDTFKRALLKSKGEGTVDETLQRFLMVYRTTPGEHVANKLSPAEALMGRKLRTVHSTMIPHPEARKHEQLPIPRRFHIGAPVYARDYRGNRDQWMKGTISGRRGGLIYEVNVGKDIWIRHQNQLRSRACPNTEDEDSIQLPLEILLETFDIESTTSTPDTVIKEPCLVPRRWSDRKRKKTVRFQLDPRQRRYL